ATKSGESDLDNTESTSRRGKPMIVSSVFHGVQPCHSSPNRLAVSVTQLGSPKARPRLTYYPGKEVGQAFQPDKAQSQAGKPDLHAFLSCRVNSNATPPLR